MEAAERRGEGEELNRELRRRGMLGDGSGGSEGRRNV